MEPASHQPTQPEQTPPWEPTACILCENNCGIEVQLGGDDGRQFTRLRGDRANPVSKGYVCQKAGRLNHYQNSRDRVLSPLRRRPDGSFEEIDWDTAIREVAERFAGIRDRFGGESIFYYGGGGQGNHLPGFYARSTLRTLGSVFRSNALAQEKTGEMWVAGQMVGAHSRGDFHHCEVGIFLGKNPWQSHGVPRARVTLRELAKDPERCLIVIDVRRSETADLADIFLQVKPGTRRLAADGDARRPARGRARERRVHRPPHRRFRGGSPPTSSRPTSAPHAPSAAFPKISSAPRSAGSPGRRAFPCSRISASR